MTIDTTDLIARIEVAASAARAGTLAAADLRAVLDLLGTVIPPSTVGSHRIPPKHSITRQIWILHVKHGGTRESLDDVGGLFAAQVPPEARDELSRLLGSAAAQLHAMVAAVDG